MVSGQLNYMREIGFAAGDHFWILKGPLQDSDIHAASSIHAQIIEFHKDFSWEENVLEFFQIARNHNAEEPFATPVLPRVSATSEKKYSASELVQEEPDSIRRILTTISPEFMEKDGSFLYEKYEGFCREYDTAIHLATRVRVEPPNNTWLGMPITSEVGAGVFGKVYSATNSQGIPVAIKIAREEVRDDRDMLNSFRRGVEAMDILTEDNFAGVSKLLMATELPPSIVMEFIDGVNLEYAVANSALKTSDEVIAIVLRVAQIVHSCHRHKKGILHRDLRPSNIMLTGEWWHNAQQCEVTVLDFDLSWFFGAKDRSFIMKAGAAMGYLAPEQLNRTSEFSSRNALVDVYGISMLLYFLLSEKHPIANVSIDPKWSSTIYADLIKAHNSTWRIFRRRLARIIESGTSVDQNARPTMQFVIDELETLMGLSSGKSPILLEYYLEEIFCKMFLNEFQWDRFTKQAVRQLASGVAVRGQAKEDIGEIDLTIEYTGQGFIDRKNLGKFIREKGATCRQILISSRIGKVSYDERLGGLIISIKGIKLQSEQTIQIVCRALDRVIAQFDLR